MHAFKSQERQNVTITANVPSEIHRRSCFLGPTAHGVNCLIISSFFAPRVRVHGSSVTGGVPGRTRRSSAPEFSCFWGGLPSGADETGRLKPLRDLVTGRFLSDSEVDVPTGLGTRASWWRDAENSFSAPSGLLPSEKDPDPQGPFLRLRPQTSWHLQHKTADATPQPPPPPRRHLQDFPPEKCIRCSLPVTVT